jgi:fructokinase
LINQVWVCGEVLIDLIPKGKLHKAVVGGGPANTAKALAKLGIATQFIDGVSTDKYGEMAIKDLRDNGVKLNFIKISKKPTCVALVTLNELGSAQYEFTIENTATFDFSKMWLPDAVVEKPSLLHIGTLVTVIEPASSILFDWVKEVANVAPIVYDPNIRPVVMNDNTEYVRLVEHWLTISNAVKVSDEDLNWLYPGQKIDEVISRWLKIGPELIIVTLGEKGLIGYRNSESIYVKAEKVIVADTVGAGDTVGAILVEAIINRGVSNITGLDLEIMLKRAARAAAVTVSRTGACPPSYDEI